MRVADHYVWVYTKDRLNTPHWWTGRLLPDVYLDVTARAKEDGRRKRPSKPFWLGSETDYLKALRAQ